MIISNPYILGLLGALVIIVTMHLAEKYLIRRPSWRKHEMGPASHAVAAERVVKFVDVIAANPGQPDNEIVASLTRGDVPKVNAELVVRFVPIAFAWVLLRRMGASSFPSTFMVFDKHQHHVIIALT